jgi:hypothetical protein
MQKSKKEKNVKLLTEIMREEKGKRKNYQLLNYELSRLKSQIINSI